MKLFRINSILTALRALIGWPLLVIGAYLMAALVGSLIPANRDWQQAGQGIDLFVETNGVHVSLILPVTAAGEDLSDVVRLDQLPDRQLFGTHVMIGWGHDSVYRNAETWSQVRAGDIGSAIFGSENVLLHVYHLVDPQPAAHRKKFRVTPDQFRTIVRDIRSQFNVDAAGRTIAASAYGPDNLFYDAKGRYTAIHTCNEWSAAILRRAGVRVGVWTPMPGGVMRWF